MRSTLLGLPALAPLFALQMGALQLVACSASVAAPGSSADSLLQDAAEGTSSAAVVVLERTVTADDSAHASAVARFVKMRSGSVDDQALRMVGATLELPALGTCSASGATAPGDAVVLEAVQPEHDLLTPRAVELLNVGALAIDANGAHTMLEARALPDIVDLVTGVFYSAHASNPEMDALPSRGGYVVRASGSSPAADAEHGLPSFSVAATAPGEPSDLRIGGQDARTEAGLVLDAKAPVELAWSVGDADEADPTDVVYVDLISAVDEPSKSHAAAVRCVFPDHGLASIPASAFVVDGGVEELRHGTLVVHRVHREVFQVPGRGPGQIGIDSGVVRFDFARAADFTRR